MSPRLGVLVLTTALLAACGEAATGPSNDVALAFSADPRVAAVGSNSPIYFLVAVANRSSRDTAWVTFVQTMLLDASGGGHGGGDSLQVAIPPGRTWRENPPIATYTLPDWPVGLRFATVTVTGRGFKLVGVDTVRIVAK